MRIRGGSIDGLGLLSVCVIGPFYGCRFSQSRRWERVFSPWPKDRRKPGESFLGESLRPIRAIKEEEEEDDDDADSDREGDNNMVVSPAPPAAPKAGGKKRKLEESTSSDDDDEEKKEEVVGPRGSKEGKEGGKSSGEQKLSADRGIGNGIKAPSSPLPPPPKPKKKQEGQVVSRQEEGTVIVVRRKRQGDHGGEEGNEAPSFKPSMLLPKSEESNWGLGFSGKSVPILVALLSSRL